MDPNASILGRGDAAPAVQNAVDATPSQAVPPAAPAERPWLSFPPFPKPPPGTDLIPFKDFKPLGIQIVQDPESGSIELDGLGIPTLTLRVHHDLAAMGKRKHKNKNKVGVDGFVRGQIWYEEWAETEHMRRLSAAIDPSSLRSDRLHQAAQDFKAGRPLQQNQHLLQLWDRFRIFLGLISTLQPPVVRKKQAAIQDLIAASAEQGDDDDDGEDDDMPNASLPAREQTVLVANGDDASTQRPSYPPRAQPSTMNEEQRQHRREYYREVCDTKMDRFLNDPELCVKIFLSGYYRDRGMIFSEKFCRDGPILIEFFLNFLLRNRVFPESEKNLRKALAATAEAKKELPHALVVSRVVPDDFSKGCEMLFGTLTHAMVWTVQDGTGDDNEESEAEREAKRQKTDADPSATAEAAILQAAVGSEKIEVVTPDIAMSMEQDMKKELQAEADEEAGKSANANGNNQDQDTTTKPAEPAEATADTNTNGWGNTDIADWDNPNDATDWGTGPTRNPLSKYLGPTTLLLTHTTGVIERSVRRIKSVMMPQPAPAPSQRKSTNSSNSTAQSVESSSPSPSPNTEAVERELEARFARMTLIPWHEWDLHDKADVQKPRLLPDSRGAAVTDDCEGAKVTEGAGPVHNPFKDEIDVFLEPESADKMMVGMGIDATWIQLARVDPQVPIEVDPEFFSNPWSYGKKKIPGGPGIPVALTKIWYMEQVLAVLPSFHEEMIPLPTEEEILGEEA